MVQVNVILAWPVTKIFIVQTWLSGRGIRSGVAVRGFVSGMGPAAVAVGRIAPTGRTAPKAPAGITCPHFCDFKSINEVVFEDIKI